MPSLSLALLLPCFLLGLRLTGQGQPQGQPSGPLMEQAVRDYAADLRDLGRRYDVPLSGERIHRLRSYLTRKLAEEIGRAHV